MRAWHLKTRLQGLEFRVCSSRAEAWKPEIIFHPQASLKLGAILPRFRFGFWLRGFRFGFAVKAEPSDSLIHQPIANVSHDFDKFGRSFVHR